MADETQNAPVAGAEEPNATQENNATQAQDQATKGFTYYFSDPDSNRKELHCLVINLQFELAELPWHWHTEKPDESLIDPIWDLKTNGWVENSKDGQAAILQEATQKIEELDKKSEELDKKNAALDQANDKFDQAMKTMQQVQAQSSQQNVALMKSFAQQTQNTNKMLATMQQTLAMVVKSTQKEATPEAPKTDASAQPATDKQENGGN